MAKPPLYANSPGINWRKVIPSDTVDLPDGACRALLVGTPGNARIIDAGGTDTGVDLVPLQVGWNPGGVRRIYATGLTASNIWAIY
jgi:hypothetical protein